MSGMVMEYRNASILVQRVMNKVLGGLIGKGVKVYLGDIVMH
jgi:hypothetical protein